MKILPIANLNKKPSGGPVIPPFVTGADGALTILNGQTVNLTAGVIKQYTSVDIQAGGTLNINGSSMTQILVRDSFTVNGTIRQNGIESGTFSSSGTTVSGQPYSFTVTQMAGGAGGVGGNPAFGSGGAGGAQSNGYGGGGGGGAAYSGDLKGSVTANGGAGGTANGNGTAGQCSVSGTGTSCAQGAGGTGNVTNGAGSNASNQNGASGGGSGGGGGASAHFGGDAQAVGGGGGGGGHKGGHGGILFIYSVPTITGTGTFDLSGQNGFAGGNGRSYVADTAGGGGGGGAGAGGSGGHVIIEVPSYTVTTNVAGGAGAAGGLKGANYTSSSGANGSPSQAGLSGSVTFIATP